MIRRVYRGWAPVNQTQATTLCWFVSGGRVIETKREVLDIYGPDCEPIQVSVGITVRHGKEK